MIVWREKSANSGTAWVTLGIIAANCLVFFAVNLVHQGRGISEYGVTPSSFNIATLLTAPFLHGGFLHLLGNMYFLWVFGQETEEAIGRGVYFGFYFLFGVIAGMADLVARSGSNVPAIGASGAISGVMAMYCIIYPSKQFRFLSFTQGVKNISAIGLIMFFLVLDLLGAVGSDDGVAHFAHLGGTFCGAFMGFIFRVAGIVELGQEAPPLPAAAGKPADPQPGQMAPPSRSKVMTLADRKPEYIMAVAKNLQAKKDEAQQGLTRKFLVLAGTLGILLFIDPAATIVGSLGFVLLAAGIVARLAFVRIFPMMDSPLDFFMKWGSKLFWVWYALFWFLWLILHAGKGNSGYE